MIRRISLLLVCLVIWGCFGIPTFASENLALEELLQARMTAAGAENLQAWLDGELSDSAGETAEWVVIALHHYAPQLDYTAYADALEAYIVQNPSTPASTQQKYALSLLAAGRNSAYLTDIVDKTAGELGIMSWIYALHLLHAGLPSEKYTEADVVRTLLDLRLEDGGWALTGTRSNADVTAMALQALAPYVREEAVSTAVTGALALLSDLRLPNGDFESYGVPNPESTAQVIIALDALGHEELLEDGDYLNGMTKYRLPDGTYSHMLNGPSNLNATNQVMLALAALASDKGLYDLALPAQEVQPLPEAESQPVIREEPAAETPDEKISTKAIICLVILAIAALVCLLLVIRGRRSPKNFLFVGGIAVALCGLTLLLNVQSREEFSRLPVKDNPIGRVTITIRCDAIVGEENSEFIPEDGVILPLTVVELAEGETIYDITLQAAKAFDIHLENTGGATGELAYMSGINHLYELQFGDLSGWVYRINGENASVGCGAYKLSDGDAIEWHYTRDLGNDLNQS